jgi:hypothetical protein
MSKTSVWRNPDYHLEILVQQGLQRIDKRKKQSNKTLKTTLKGMSNAT